MTSKEKAQNLFDRYWELRCEIINTPPIYFIKLKRLFREYKEVKQEIENIENQIT